MGNSINIMSNNIAIKVENLSKVYKLYDKPTDRLKESLHLKGKKYHKDFYALNDVSFEIKKGETVGIIGKNGSGKSTLLKIITGVLSPTSGKITVNGKVSALLELGAGFNPEYTGIENIYFQGNLMGYTKEQMDSRLQDILDFADIGDFIYQPVKMYSSGMFARLAFAVAINVEPDILIVDEALSVGDMQFQNKCIRRMEEFTTDSNKSIIFVSHDIGIMTKFCNNVLWLNDGSRRQYDIAKETLKSYTLFMTYNDLSHIVQEPLSKNKPLINNSHSDSNNIKWISVKDADSYKINDGTKISDIALFSRDSSQFVSIVSANEKLSLYIKIINNNVKNGLGIGLNWLDKLNTMVFTVNNYMYEEYLDNVENESIIRIDFVLPQICNGDYIISVACAEGSQQNHIQHHWVYFGMSVIVRTVKINHYIATSAKIWIDPKEILFNKGLDN